VAGLATDLATSGVLRRAALWRFARGEYGYIPTAPTRADDLPAVLGDCAEGCDGQAAIQLLDHVLRYLAPPQVLAAPLRGFAGIQVEATGWRWSGRSQPVLAAPTDNGIGALW
jgi:hypothetical protein